MIRIKAAEGLRICHLIEEDGIHLECIPGDTIREGSGARDFPDAERERSYRPNA
jgi:hypothetical protein